MSSFGNQQELREYLLNHTIVENDDLVEISERDAEDIISLLSESTNPTNISLMISFLSESQEDTAIEFMKRLSEKVKDITTEMEI